ncbi:unnamed protein product, partial [Meganyctiphanes norvegica]
KTEQLVNILIPKPEKVVCIREAFKSEVQIFEIPENLRLNSIPLARKIVYLKEDDHDSTAEPSDDEKNEDKMSKLELYLSYLKNHISIVASLEYCPCINSLQYYKARKIEIRSHLQEDWMKNITKEDIEKAKQDFKVIFEAAKSLQSNINERFLDVY